MGGYLSALMSALHVAGIAMVVTFSTLRLMALRRHDVAATRLADNGNGIGAIFLYGAGVWRLFGELEKPLAFYTSNPVFWTKITLLGLATALELYPQMVVIPWHVRHARKLPIQPKPRQFERMYWCAVAELACIVAIVFCATVMARGIGLPTPPSAPPSDLPGQAIYVRYCQSCHQADGRGLDGKVAASFVDDPRVLAKPDDVLLASISRGITGPIGAMPGWTPALTPHEQRQVLEYIRHAFATAPQRR